MQLLCFPSRHLLDGAVNGMVIRLTSAGFAPNEAFSLAQAAYIKAKKRGSSVLPTVVSRSEATWESDEALNELGPYQMGVEAHRTRIRLWEEIFGFRSWHERVDPLEVYTPLELLAHGIVCRQKPRRSPLLLFRRPQKKAPRQTLLLWSR